MQDDHVMSTAFCQIVGFGPGCVSFLVAADRCGILQQLLEQGLVIWERSPGRDALIKGGISYDIVSNSSALDFIEQIDPDGLFADVLKQGPALVLKSLGAAPAPLMLVSALIHDLRHAIMRILDRYPRSAVYLGQDVTSVTSERDAYVAQTNLGLTMTSPHFVLAAGSHAVIPDNIAFLAQAVGVKTLHGEAFLRPGGQEKVPTDAVNIVVIGGSHSAFSVLHKLLEVHCVSDLNITLVHRKPVRRMHLSTQEALACGEQFDLEQDVCPTSGRVFRFQGLYTRSRVLFDQINAGLHPNLKIRGGLKGAELSQTFKRADIVIAATGYIPRVPKMHDANNRVISIGYVGNTVWVDNHSRIRKIDGQILSGLYGIGLGYGRQQSAIGEPSYEGAPVGVNIFQGPDGAAICNQLSAAILDEQRKVG